MKGNETLRKMFYRNRHVFITIITCCQDDTDLPANLRKNAFISFYTTQPVCQANFGRTANAYSAQVRKDAEDISKVLFVDRRKMVYIRDDERGENFYYYDLKFPARFMFGSPAFHELSNAVKATGTSMDEKNPFYSVFKVK
jgi:hypothetical protein